MRIARRLTTIVPAMSLAEALETTRIHRVAGRAMATKSPEHV
jgi:predicted ATPase with chaperone activity